jgi:hypothetical protein
MGAGAICTARHGFSRQEVGKSTTERTLLANKLNGHIEGDKTMGLIILVLLLALLLGGLGFASHIFWIIAAVVFIAWLVGFGVARGEGSGGRARWYRW